MKIRNVFIIILFIAFNSRLSANPPQPQFESYTLGMKKKEAVKISPAHKTIQENTLGLSAIIFRKNKLKYALWFYKNKLQGLLITGKVKTTEKKKLAAKYSQLYGPAGTTFEYGKKHYYWYFYRNSVLYTIEIKLWRIDIHYSISDTGYGPRP